MSAFLKNSKHAIKNINYGVFFLKIHIELDLDKLHLKNTKIEKWAHKDE